MKDLAQQRTYLERLRLHLGYSSRKPLVQDIADLLDLSPASVYGRFNGTTALSMDEYIAIRDHFRYRHQPDGKDYAFAMTSVRELSRMDVELRATLDAGDKLYFGSTEIPVFYLFLFPPLAALKLHYWLHRSAGDPNLPLRPFRYERAAFAADPFYRDMVALTAVYEDIVREEIWMPGMLDNLCAQLVGLRERGLVEAATDALLRRSMDTLLLYLNDSFADPVYASRTAWYNEQSSTNGRVLREGDGRRIVYLTGTDLLIYKHTSVALYDDFWHIWERQRRFAVPLTTGSHRDRQAFFAGMRRRVVSLLD